MSDLLNPPDWYLETTGALTKATASLAVGTYYAVIRKMGKSGFGGYAYKDAEVVPAGGMSGNCPSAHMYFVNTDFIHYRPHADRNVEVIGGDRESTNQDAFVRLIGWAGNMTLSNAFLQGVLTA